MKTRPSRFQALGRSGARWAWGPRRPCTALPGPVEVGADGATLQRRAVQRLDHPASHGVVHLDDGVALADVDLPDLLSVDLGLSGDRPDEIAGPEPVPLPDTDE